MAYLHQHKIFHGRLHSRNCVVDDRWVCKISGKKKKDICKKMKEKKKKTPLSFSVGFSLNGFYDLEAIRPDK